MKRGRITYALKATTPSFYRFGDGEELPTPWDGLHLLSAGYFRHQFEFLSPARPRQGVCDQKREDVTSHHRDSLPHAALLSRACAVIVVRLLVRSFQVFSKLLKFEN